MTIRFDDIKDRWILRARDFDVHKGNSLIILYHGTIKYYNRNQSIWHDFIKKILYLQGLVLFNDSLKCQTPGLITYLTGFNVYVLYLAGQSTDFLKLVIAYGLVRKEKWVKNLAHTHEENLVELVD